VATVQKLQPAYSRLANLALIVVIDQEFIHIFSAALYQPRCCSSASGKPGRGPRQPFRKEKLEAGSFSALLPFTLFPASLDAHIALPQAPSVRPSHLIMSHGAGRAAAENSDWLPFCMEVAIEYATRLSTAAGYDDCHRLGLRSLPSRR
jgi:hypothetical protein